MPFVGLVIFWLALVGFDWFGMVSRGCVMNVGRGYVMDVLSSGRLSGWMGDMGKSGWWVGQMGG